MNFTKLLDDVAELTAGRGPLADRFRDAAAQVAERRLDPHRREGDVLHAPGGGAKGFFLVVVNADVGPREPCLLVLADLDPTLEHDDVLDEASPCGALSLRPRHALRLETVDLGPVVGVISREALARVRERLAARGGRVEAPAPDDTSPHAHWIRARPWETPSRAKVIRLCSDMPSEVHRLLAASPDEQPAMLLTYTLAPNLLPGSFSAVYNSAWGLTLVCTPAAGQGPPQAQRLTAAVPQELTWRESPTQPGVWIADVAGRCDEVTVRIACAAQVVEWMLKIPTDGGATRV